MPRYATPAHSKSERTQALQIVQFKLDQFEKHLQTGRRC